MTREEFERWLQQHANRGDDGQYTPELPEGASENQKQAAIERYNKLKADAKKELISLVKENIKSGIEAVLVATGIRKVLDIFNMVKSTVDTAATTYTSAEQAAAVVKARAISSKEMIAEAKRQAQEIIKNRKLNSNGLDIDFGIQEKIVTLATVDPSIEPDNSDAGLILKVNGAKVKLDSINELVKVIQTINNKLNSEDPVSTRAWIHKLAKLHPIVDDQIKNLEYFKPISNEVGSTHMMHTPDTQTLALEDWETELASLFRNGLKVKLSKDTLEHNHIYYKLNQGMVRNISTEFYYERWGSAVRDHGNSPYLAGKTIYNNDFHIAGDYTFAEDHTSKLYAQLMTILLAKVGGAGKLINWLKPVNTFDSALCSGLTISVEGNDVVVDLKGNKIGVIATIIDKTPIKTGDYK